MNKIYFFIALSGAFSSVAQTFPGPYGEPGSTAIPKDSVCFTAWATGGTVYRGFVDINDTNATGDGHNRASFGTINNTFGKAQGSAVNVLSLGDSGYVTLTFDQYVFDGPGFDFAVFENGFDDNYMELAHVEVSSDGLHFFRFPSTSEAPTDEQQDNFTYSDCRYIDNLAGKYKVGYGTPFDISDLPNDPQLNKNGITHIRVVDVIGDITGNHRTFDHSGTVINDPYPTAFASGGFDLDAVGIMNATAGLPEQEQVIAIWPNPATDVITIRFPGQAIISIYTVDGQLVYTQDHLEQSQVSPMNPGLKPGTYFIHIKGDAGNEVHQLILSGK